MAHDLEEIERPRTQVDSIAGVAARYPFDRARSSRLALVAVRARRDPKRTASDRVGDSPIVDALRIRGSDWASPL